jgi:hypothetical protein
MYMESHQTLLRHYDRHTKQSTGPIDEKDPSCLLGIARPTVGIRVAPSDPGQQNSTITLLFKILTVQTLL